MAEGVGERGHSHGVESSRAVFAALLDVLEPAAETLLAAGAKISLVLGRLSLPDVHDDHVAHFGGDRGVGPTLDYAAVRPRCGAVEKRLHRIHLIEPQRDGEAVHDHLAVVQFQRRHRFASAAKQGGNLQELDRRRGGAHALQRQRHPDAPAVRREAASVSCSKFVELHVRLSTMACATTQCSPLWVIAGEP